MTVRRTIAWGVIGGAFGAAVATAHVVSGLDRPAALQGGAPQARPALPPDTGPTGIIPPGLPSAAVLQPQQSLRVPQQLRLLVVAPHPDDETLGAGGLIRRVVEQGGTVQVLVVTNGDGYPIGVRAEVRGSNVSRRDYVAYGERRQAEALRALRVLGGEHVSATFLGFPDDGIDDLWAENWSEARPYRSPFTESDRPPYQTSVRHGIEYSGVDLRRELRAALQHFAPDWVVIPDPRDRHPDHCTTGVFVLDALRELRTARVTPFSRTEVFTYLVHYPEYPGNPLWQTLISAAGIGGSAVAQASLSHTTWRRLDLTASEVERKREALMRHRSQMRLMERFLSLFVRDREVFGHLDGAQIARLPREYAARWRSHQPQ